MTDNSNKLCIDLCSGLGGFSRAFVDVGWEVITVDIDPKFKPTICADINSIDWVEFDKDILHGRKVNVLLASPDCRLFSIAGLRYGWPRPGIKQSLSLVGACFEAVATLKPIFWAIENPLGRLRQIIGKPNQTIRYSDFDPNYPLQKPTDIWGNIQLGLATGIRRPYSGAHFHKPYSGWPRDRSKRALIPIGVSKAILEAVEAKA